MRYTPKSFVVFLAFLFSFVLCCSALAELSDIRNAVLDGDYAQVKQLCEDFLYSDHVETERQEAFYFLGLSGLYLGHYKEARGSFKQASEPMMNKDLSDQAFLGIVSSYYLEGKYRMSLRWAHDFLRKRPDSNFLSTAYLKIARANLKLSHFRPAQRYLEKILKEFNDSLDAFVAKQLLEERAFFTVQVGAFLDADRAHRLVEELRFQGEYAFIVQTTDRHGRIFYRVRVGEVSSLSSARRTEERLAGFGYPTIIYP